jgi:hypothetical protein
MSTAGKHAGAVRVDVLEGTRTASSGTSRRGYVDEPITVPLQTIEQPLEDATVCIANPGPVQVAVLGFRTSRAREAKISRGRNFAGSKAWLGWQKRHAPSRLSRLGAYAERDGLAKASFFGTWTFWAGAALLLAAAAGAVALVLREARP